MYNFLQVTNQLEPLEIGGRCAITAGSKSVASITFTTCLSSLVTSYSSLRHLRLISIEFNERHRFNLSNFKNLKIICLDRLLLEKLTENEFGPFPSSLEMPHLPYYDFANPDSVTNSDFDEELDMSDLLNSPISLNIFQIFVPVLPIGIR